MLIDKFLFVGECGNLAWKEASEVMGFSLDDGNEIGIC